MTEQRKKLADRLAATRPDQVVVVTDKTPDHMAQFYKDNPAELKRYLLPVNGEELNEIIDALRGQH